MARQAYSPTVRSIPRLGGDYARAIASRQQTEFILTGGVFGEDEHPSEIVRKKSEPGDRLGDIYVRMMDTDAMIAGLWEKRAKAVTGLPWSLAPGDGSVRAQQIADAATEMLYGIQQLETNLSHQLGCVAMGVAFDELIWGLRTTGKVAEMVGAINGTAPRAWVVSELIDRPMHRFGFKDGVLCVRRRDGSLEPVPPGRILHTTHGTKDTPWGMALLDRVWWFYFLTLHVLKYWGVGTEKWAQPTVEVEYTYTDDEKLNAQRIAEALAVGEAFQTQLAYAKPKDSVNLNIKEANRSGSAEYSAFLQLLDRAKALVFLGEVDTSGLSQGPGSFAKNRVSNEVRYETIDADATELANSLTDGLIAPWVRVNFGPDAPIPYWEFDVEEASDRKLRQEAAAAALEAGVDIPLGYYSRLHQVPIAKPGEPVVKKRRSTAPRASETSLPGAPAPPNVLPPAAAPDWADQELERAA